MPRAPRNAALVFGIVAAVATVAAERVALVQLAEEPLFTALGRDRIGVRSVEWKRLH